MPIKPKNFLDFQEKICYFYFLGPPHILKTETSISSKHSLLKYGGHGLGR